MWAHHRRFPQHRLARGWWEETLSTAPRVGVPWATILAFLRLSTHARVVSRPLTAPEAWRIVAGWLDRPNVWIPLPGERHADLFERLFTETRATGNDVPDAHLAALAVEWGLELLTADAGFARYPGLRWRDPLRPR